MFSSRADIPYDMFDTPPSADEARRFARCERIYHRSQELAWDGQETLRWLVDKHGLPEFDPATRDAMGRLFTIILWGEMAAWKISAQLADRLEPLEAKMAATSQAFDEARHFYVIHDYLELIGYQPQRMHRAPETLLRLVMTTDNMAHKLLGMQLLVETMALTLFQTIRELRVDPLLSELLTYFERDEARHVGLGVQYLPSLMGKMSRRELAAMGTFQARVLFYALWENKVLEPDFRTLGIDPREILERGRRKQIAAITACLEKLGWPVDGDRNIAIQGLNAAVELLFPLEADARANPLRRVRAAWSAFWRRADPADQRELSVHARHAIRTARGGIVDGESAIG